MPPNLRRKSVGDEPTGSSKKQERLGKRTRSLPAIPQLTRAAVLQHLKKAQRDGGFSTLGEEDWLKCYGGKVEVPKLPNDFASARHVLPDLEVEVELEEETRRLLFHRVLEGYIRTRDLILQGPEKCRYLVIQASVLDTFGLLSPSFSQAGFEVALPDQPPSADARAMEQGAQTKGEAELRDGGPNVASQILEEEGLDGESFSGAESEQRRPFAEAEQAEQSSASTSGNSPEVFLIGKEDLKVSFEEYLRGNFAKGPVEFVVYEKATARLLGVIEVKKTLGAMNIKECLYQLFAQMCALVEINARRERAETGGTGSQPAEQRWEVWGILTDGDDWFFAVLTARVVVVRSGQGGKNRWGVIWGKSVINLSRPYNLFTTMEEPSSDTGACVSCLARFLAPQISKMTTPEVAALFQQASERLGSRVARGMDAYDKFHPTKVKIGHASFEQLVSYWEKVGQKAAVPSRGATVLGEPAANVDSMDSVLDQLGCGSYKQKFKEEKVGIDILPLLTEADLEKLGVLMGDRKRIAKYIGKLKGNAS